MKFLINLKGGGFILGIILVIIIFLSAIILFLHRLEKRLKEKFKLQKEDRNLFYLRKIEKLNDSLSTLFSPRSSKERPENILHSLDTLARDFFMEAFGLPYSLEYSELVGEFEKRQKKEATDFCRLMTELIYSGEKVEKEKLIDPIELLRRIVEENKIPTKEKLENEERKEKI